MVEATQSLSQIPTQAQVRITTASVVLAQLRARNAVKDQIRKQGLKPSHYSAREITGWAIVYLDEHPELIPEAIAAARTMILAGALGKRAQKAFIKELKIEQSQGERSLANG
jgi:hypothetical protein